MVYNLTESFCVRTLFTPETLGVTKYAANRELELSYTSHPEDFKTEFKNKVAQSVPLNVLISDLKKYLHLFDNVPQDIELLLKALRLFHTQRERKKHVQVDVSRRTDYIFGPIVMRAFSYFNQPTIAMKVQLFRLH